MPRRPKAPAAKKWRERDRRHKWNRYPPERLVKKLRTVADDRVKSRLPIIIDV